MALKPPHKDWTALGFLEESWRGCLLRQADPTSSAGALQCHALELPRCAELGAGAAAAGIAAAPGAG